MLEVVAAEDITLQVVVAVMEVAVLVVTLLLVVQVQDLRVLLIEVAVVVALALKDFQTRKQAERVEAVL
jgi:hypothetical protein